MGKPITKEQTEQFRKFCKDTLAEEGDGSARFTFWCLEPFTEELPDGEPLWEYHAANYNPDNTHNVYELFTSVSDEFMIEQHGYDEFYLRPKISS